VIERLTSPRVRERGRVCVWARMPENDLTDPPSKPIEFQVHKFLNLRSDI
jgi:hypothetical protein